MLLLAVGFSLLSAEAQNINVSVHHTHLPLIVDRDLNVVAEICIDNQSGNPIHFDGVELGVGKNELSKALKSCRLVYCGTMSPLKITTTSWAINDLFKIYGGGQNLYRDPSYVIPQPETVFDDSERLCLKSDVEIHQGKHYFYVSASLDEKAIESLTDQIQLEILRVQINHKKVAFTKDQPTNLRLGVAVRDQGQDGVYAYRIPGLVTTLSGTLLATYDVRYNTRLDLQENVDVGVSRSTDGGRTWEKMRIAIDMGQWGGLPDAQNGVGDASILVDEQTGEIFILALWVHGIGNNRAWTGVKQGNSPYVGSQLVMVSSRDDGRTWSEPRNITSQVKNPLWYLTLQGPGRGISMRDGTLVFPFQHIDEHKIPNAGIIYSRDHGQTWQINNYAKSNTTESQVVELEAGHLMLNMRDNRKTGRAVYTTTDLGKTWKKHASSELLREPVCMASLIHVSAQDNVLGRDLLLFSNPDMERTKQTIRSRLTIKASLDGGRTWLPENQLLLDEDEVWGYSCMSMIDDQTVGIIYEGSRAQLVYQTIKLEDIVREPNPRLCWEEVPEISIAHEDYRKGVSAAYAGFLKNRLLVAGGSNFPEKSVAEGGEKHFYDEVYMLYRNRWNLVGHLLQKMAYGVSMVVDQQLLIVGGASEKGATDQVYTLSPKANSIAIKQGTALPFTFEQGAGIAVGHKAYVFGGLADGKPSSQLLMMDLKDPTKGWQRLPESPEAFVQPVMAHSHGKLYVWGGFNPLDKTVSDHGYVFDLTAQTWTRISGVPDLGTLVGGCAATLSDGRIVVMGGVNRAIFEEAIRLPKEKIKAYLSQRVPAYQFRKTVWIFDPLTRQWNLYGSSEQSARAGATLVSTPEGLVHIGGELKPGVRTSDIFRTSIQ